MVSVFTLRPHFLNRDLDLIFILKFHSTLRVLPRQGGLHLSLPFKLYLESENFALQLSLSFAFYGGQLNPGKAITTSCPEISLLGHHKHQNMPFSTFLHMSAAKLSMLHDECFLLPASQDMLTLFSYTLPRPSSFRLLSPSLGDKL